MDPLVTLATILDDLLPVLLALMRSKPADPAVWEHVESLDLTRHQIRDAIGSEPKHLIGPNGPINPDLAKGR